MKQVNERQSRTISCPEGKGKAWIMCEWEVVSEKGQSPKRALKQIDCRNPQLSNLGGEDCQWGLRESFVKTGKVERFLKKPGNL